MRYALTTAEKALLLERPHRTRLYLVVDRPPTVMAAQVNNGAIATGARTIVYDTVTGDEADVLAGMTLRVGTTPGGNELGEVRVRAINAGTNTLTVAQNSIAWVDDAYLTVLAEFRLWSVYPRQTYTGTMDWFKDWDVDYDTNVYRKQNVWLSPVPIMGPPAVAFLDGGAATVSFVGEYSYTICPNGIKIGGVSQGNVNVSATCAWAFEGGTPATRTTLGTRVAPHTISWDTAGRYLASLTVSNDKPVGGTPTYAKATTGYRPVFILNRPGTAAGLNEPYEDFLIMSCDGDFAAGGWEATIRVFGDADITEFPDKAMIVLFAEEWYGDTQQSIGGYPGRENVKLVAYIVEETVRQEWTADGQRYVEFTVRTIDGLMKEAEACPVSVEDWPSMSTGSTEANEWWQMFKLQVNRAALFLLYWHTTLIPMCDVNIVRDNSRVQAQDFPSGSLYRQIDDYAGGAVLGRMVSDRQGCLFLEKDIQTEPGAAARAARVTVLDLNNDTHLDGGFQAVRRQMGRTRFLEVSGVVWNGSVATPIIAQAPGETPLQDGVDEQIKGLIVESQDEANEVAGYALAQRNNSWPDVPLSFQGNHSYLDIVPQGWLRMSLDAQDTKRGIEWTNKKMTPRRVSWRYDAENQLLVVNASCETEATGEAGVTGNYVPVSPIPVNPVWPEGAIPGWNRVMYVGTEDGVFRVLPSYPYWELITRKEAPFSTDPDIQLEVYDMCFVPDDLGGILGLVIATSQGLFHGYYDGDVIGGLTWEEWTLSMPVAPTGWTTPTEMNPLRVLADYNNADTFYVLSYDESNNTYLGKTSNGGATWTWFPIQSAYASGGYNYPIFSSATKGGKDLTTGYVDVAVTNKWKARVKESGAGSEVTWTSTRAGTGTHPLGKSNSKIVLVIDLGQNFDISQIEVESGRDAAFYCTTDAVFSYSQSVPGSGSQNMDQFKDADGYGSLAGWDNVETADGSWLPSGAIGWHTVWTRAGGESVTARYLAFAATLDNNAAWASAALAKVRNVRVTVDVSSAGFSLTGYRNLALSHKTSSRVYVSGQWDIDAVYPATLGVVVVGSAMSDISNILLDTTAERFKPGYVHALACPFYKVGSALDDDDVLLGAYGPVEGSTEEWFLKTNNYFKVGSFTGIEDADMDLIDDIGIAATDENDIVAIGTDSGGDVHLWDHTGVGWAGTWDELAPPFTAIGAYGRDALFHARVVRHLRTVNIWALIDPWEKQVWLTINGGGSFFNVTDNLPVGIQLYCGLIDWGSVLL